MKREFTNLYYELEKRKISKEQFAGMVGVTSNSVQNWFEQNSQPFKITKEKMAQVLSVTAADVDKLLKFTNK